MAASRSRRSWKARTRTTAQARRAAAIAAADRFIRTYPNHPNVDYAYYLKGLVNFREDQGLLGYVYELDLSERDPKAMKRIVQRLQGARAKFPDSQYAEDAQSRACSYLSNALGIYEVHVARYYYNRGAYLAAANRAQAALINYPRTPANEDALAMLMRSYEKLGMEQLARGQPAHAQEHLPGQPLPRRRRRAASLGGSSGERQLSLAILEAGGPAREERHRVRDSRVRAIGGRLRHSVLP